MLTCARCGEKFYQRAGRPAKLCPAHADRYGQAHQQKRATEIEDAYGTPCSRCGKTMERGQTLHLDHVDGGLPDEYRGFSHSDCNLRASNYRAAARARAGSAARNGEVEPARFPQAGNETWPWHKVAPGTVDRSDLSQWAPTQNW